MPLIVYINTGTIYVSLLLPLASLIVSRNQLVFVADLLSGSCFKVELHSFLLVKRGFFKGVVKCLLVESILIFFN